MSFFSHAIALAHDVFLRKRVTREWSAADADGAAEAVARLRDANAALAAGGGEGGTKKARAPDRAARSPATNGSGGGSDGGSGGGGGGSGGGSGEGLSPRAAVSAAAFDASVRTDVFGSPLLHHFARSMGTTTTSLPRVFRRAVAILRQRALDVDDLFNVRPAVEHRDRDGKHVISQHNRITQ